MQYLPKNELSNSVCESSTCWLWTLDHKSSPKLYGLATPKIAAKSSLSTLTPDLLAFIVTLNTFSSPIFSNFSTLGSTETLKPGGWRIREVYFPGRPTFFTFRVTVTDPLIFRTVIAGLLKSRML
ncbi:lecithin:cholesterol acyltransferase [Striga asiatica]|uniref:Lecithin:cholesterol acyltransferase n=1 Tax=Striga asiatica TaxID=4170 RepID=A0A5A7R572_STRAF|nr:lecithin:cholesterol acyltransferase [Striga asiatica]